MAAKALGWETVPVQWVDVTPEEELRILVVDNRTTRIGQDDTTKITDILAELANTPIGLDGTGYSAVDLDALIDSLTGTGEPEELLTDPDEVPEVVETRCQPGDLWILGNHQQHHQLEHKRDTTWATPCLYGASQTGLLQDAANCW